MLVSPNKRYNVVAGFASKHHTAVQHVRASHIGQCDCVRHVPTATPLPRPYHLLSAVIVSTSRRSSRNNRNLVRSSPVVRTRASPTRHTWRGSGGVRTRALVGTGYNWSGGCKFLSHAVDLRCRLSAAREQLWAARRLLIANVSCEIQSTSECANMNQSSEVLMPA